MVHNFVFWIYFIVAIYFVTVLGQLRYEVVETPEETPSEEVKWMLMPGGKNDVQVAILSGLEPRYKPTMDTVQFFLYTRQNPTRAEMRTMNESCLPVFKYFKSGRPSKVLIHGFGDSIQYSLMYPLLRDAYLARGDYNVFLVDWSQLAATPWYYSAASNTEPVAKHTASWLDHLSKSTGANMQDFHLIGFSLGAHIVGLTGKKITTGRIKKITGLDPAQVLFTKAGPDTRLDSSDADLVEVVHTSGGYLGFQKPLGHRDFYPNGGSWPQPGCFLDYAAVCSHRRAYYYYEESIKKGKGFQGVRCDSWSDFMEGKCKNNSAGALQLANNNKDKHLKGNFFFGTNPETPFGIYTQKKV